MNTGITAIIGIKAQDLSEDQKQGIWKNILGRLRVIKWNKFVHKQIKESRKIMNRGQQQNPANKGTLKKNMKQNKKMSKEQEEDEDNQDNEEQRRKKQQEEEDTDEEKAKRLGFTFRLIDDEKYMKLGPKCTDISECTMFDLKKRGNSIPISNQTVMGYKHLLTHKKQKQIMHLPAFDINQLNEDDLAKSGERQSEGFMSFKDILRLNKVELLKLKEEREDFQHLNFSDIQGGDGVMGVIQRKIKNYTRDRLTDKIMSQVKVDHNRYVFEEINKKMKENLQTIKKDFEKTNQISEYSQQMGKTKLNRTGKGRSESVNLQKEKQPIKVAKKWGKQYNLITPSTSLQQNVYINAQYDSNILNQFNDYQNQEVKYKFNTIGGLNANIYDYDSSPLNNNNNNNEKDFFSTSTEKGSEGIGQLGWWYQVNHINQEGTIYSREGAGMVYVEQEAYLYGGISSNVFGDVYHLKLNKGNKLIQWKQMDLNENERGTTPNYSYGHSLNYYNHQLILFGGERKFDLFTQKHKQLINEVWTLDLKQKMWQLKPTHGFTVPQRRHHSSTVLGKYLIVYGGMDKKDRYMRDTYYLNMEKYKWKQLKIKNQLPESAFHTSCTVVHGIRKENTLKFKQLFDLKLNRAYEIVYEGIYFFGGVNNNNEINGKLRVIELMRQPVEWIEPNTQGLPPSPRHSHHMVFNNKLNIIVIHGGKHDLTHNCYLSDTHLLYLNNMNWVQINNSGKVPAPRANGNIGFFDSKIYVFGGLNEQGYLNSDVSILELDKDISSNFKTRDISIMKRYEMLKQIKLEERKTNSVREQRLQELYMQDSENELLSQRFTSCIPMKDEKMKQIFEEFQNQQHEEEHTITIHRQKYPKKTYCQSNIKYIEKAQEKQYFSEFPEIKKTLIYENAKENIKKKNAQHLKSRKILGGNTIDMVSQSQENSKYQPDVYERSQYYVNVNENVKITQNGNTQNVLLNQNDENIEQTLLLNDLQKLNVIMSTVSMRKDNIMAKIKDMVGNQSIVTNIKKNKNHNSSIQETIKEYTKQQQQNEKDRYKISEGDLMSRRMQQKKYRIMPVKSSRSYSVV